MSTQVFFRGSNMNPISHRGTNDARLDTTADGWRIYSLSTTRGSSAVSLATNTVAGPTNGIEIFSTSPIEWLSPPLAASVTIANGIVVNLRMAESSMQANVGAQVVIERLNNTDGIVSTVANSEKGTELGTSEAGQNWTIIAADVTDTTFNKGDRIRIRVAGNDVGTMGNGFTFTFWFDGPTANSSGDSYVTFFEDITFETTDPTGSKFWLLDTASSVNPGSAIEKLADIVNNGGTNVNSFSQVNVDGFISPYQITNNTTDDTPIEWYSDPLEAFTLSGLVKARVYGDESTIGDNAGLRAELAVVDNDGTNPTIFGSGGINKIGGTGQVFGELSTTTSTIELYMCGSDIAVTAGQRLRFRFYLDDCDQAIANAATGTFIYNSSSGTGESWVQIPQTVTLASTQPKFPHQIVGFRNTYH